MRIIIIYRSAVIASHGLLLAGLLAATPSFAANKFVYTVAVDSALHRLQIEARFGIAMSEIAARSRDAGRFLLDARSCENDRRVVVRGSRLAVPRDGIRCLRYTVDLEAAAAADRRNEMLDASNVIVSPTAWMWRPRLGSHDRIEVRFRLPETIQVSVPWRPLPPAADTYELRASPQSGSAIAVFGRFDATVTRVADTQVRIDVLRSKHDIGMPSPVGWVRDAVHNVTLAYGRFPSPAPRVVVFPIGSTPWRSDSPVYFGRVVRDGGETVELLIDPGQPAEAFYADWTATHELSHMMLPYVRREQRWVSEGFAQYYQNVLLARAGRYTQEEAWQKLYDGFERGRESAPRLSPNGATRGGERNTRMKIYWSGAALALMADVELRRRSDGRETLDTVLAKLQRCCLPSQHAWGGRELFAKLDSFLDEPVFLRLYVRHANAAGFPDVRPLLQQLGVDVLDGEVRLRNDAGLAEIRAALTARRYTEESGR